MESSSSLIYVDKYVDEVMRYGQNWGVVLSGLAENEEHVILNVLACDLYIALEDVSKAISYLTTARSLLKGENEKDRLYVEAWEAWMSGSLDVSYERFCEILVKFPDDMLALKRGQLLAFLSGKAQKMVDIAKIPQVVQVSSGKKYYHGCLAFALEQVGRDLGQAEAEARKALDILNTDAWAQHALAHIMYFSGRNHQGLDLMLRLAPQWQDLMSFLYTHNWFHVALFQLDLDRFHDVIHTWDTRLWSQSTTESSTVTFPLVNRANSQDQLGAAGILWKLELRLHRRAIILKQQNHIDLNERWTSLANCIRLPTPHWDPLFDVILTYTLLRVARKQDAEAHIQATKDAILKQSEPRRSQLDSLLPPLLDAILLFHEGNQKASTLLQPFVQDRQRADSVRFLGGSAEQRAVIHEFILDVMLAEKQWHNAATELSFQIEARPGIAHSAFLLGFTQAHIR